MTEKLYEKDVYRDSCSSVVRSFEIIHEKGGKKRDEAYYGLLTLDRTVFFPEGGGQSCDSGEIESCPVVDVRMRDGEIIHKLLCAGRDSVTGAARGPEDACRYFDNAAFENTFAPGNTVICAIDRDKRAENMRRHCGEHILSGIFFRLFGGINHGFHMGSEYMTIDIAFEAEPGGDIPGDQGSARKYSSEGNACWSGDIAGIPCTSARKGASYIGKTPDREMVREAERAANKVILADLPVNTLYFDSHDEAMSLPLRKEMVIGEDISVVTIGSAESPADCCACCGTHPSSTAQVGSLKIYKFEKNGDMWRFYFDAGEKAMEQYAAVFEIMTDISDRFTCGIPDTPAALDAYMERSEAARSKLAALLKSVTADRAGMIVRSLRARGDRDDLLVIKYSDMAADDIIRIGQAVQTALGIDPRGRKPSEKEDAGLLDKPICLISVSENILLLFSNGKKRCGDLVKENASLYRGRGGGSAVSARALFNDLDSAELFADLLGKHLR